MKQYFHEFFYGVLHCDDTVSIQLAVDFPSFEIGFKKLCPIFQDVSFVKTFLVGVVFCPTLLQR